MEERLYTRKEVLDVANSALDRSYYDRGYGSGVTAYEGNRDYNESLGYPDKIELKEYWSMFERYGIASRIVSLPATDTWNLHPLISEYGKIDTVFVKGWKKIEEKLSIWNVFTRLDILLGLGRYGVLLIGIKGDENFAEEVTKKLTSPDDIAYLKPLSETMATVATQDEDIASPRFGLPLTYNVTVGDKAITVHYSRVIHVSEARLDSEYLGTPRLKKVFNYMLDLIKVAGGTAEAVWLNMRTGTLWGIKDDRDVDLKDAAVVAELKDEVYKLVHDPARHAFADGLTATEIPGGETSDTSSQFQTIISLISAASGIPQRVLLGSAQGQLAAAQEDSKQWFSTIQSRQQNFAEEEILRAFIDWCIQNGVLPAPSKGYTVGTLDTENGNWKWPSLFQIDDVQKADILTKQAAAIKALQDPLTMELPYSTEEIRVLLGRPPEETTNTQNTLVTHSHKGTQVLCTCPLCGWHTALIYENHAGLYLCEQCNKTYDEIEF